MMQLVLIHFDLFVLLVGLYHVNMFPMENEVINKVYHELRDIVKMQTNLASKKLNIVPAMRNETYSNETRHSSDLNATDQIRISDAPPNTTNEKDYQGKSSSDSNDAVIGHSNVTDNSSFVKDSSRRFSNPMISENNTDSISTGNVMGTNISNSNQSENINSSLQALQDKNNTNSSDIEDNFSNNSTLKLSSQFTKRQIPKLIQPKVIIINEIQDILSARIKRKTNQIGELTNEIEDILPEIRENEGDTVTVRTKRKSEIENIMNSELTDEIDDIVSEMKENEEEPLSVRTKRKTEEGNIMNSELTNEIGGELTNEIQDIQIQRRENVHHVQNDGIHVVNDHSFWKTQPSFQPYPEDAPNFANNHMHHDPHFQQNNAHSIPNDHTVHTVENDHGFRQGKGHSHLNDHNQEGHHHEQEVNQEHVGHHEHEGHHEEVGHHEHEGHHEEGHQQQNHHDQDDHEHHSSDWSSYHRGKYHHVKVRLHGPGKTPTEWAQQEQQELANSSGVVYDGGEYHDVGMGAGFFLVHCEDCIT